MEDIRSSIGYRQMTRIKQKLKLRMHGYHALDEKFRRKTICYKLVLSLIVIGTLLYILDFSTITLSIPSYSKKFLNHLSDEEDYADSVDINVNNAYFVNTIGCKMPSFPVLNDRISKFIERPPPITCPSLQLTRVNHKDLLWINDVEVNELENYFNITDYDRTLLNCYYQSFERSGDHSDTINSNKIRFKPGQYMQIKDEFISVTCEYNDSDYVYKDFYSFIPNKFLNEIAANASASTTRLRDNQLSGSDEKSGRFTKKDKSKINVMIIGIDTVSRLNLHRCMNETADTLLSKLNGIEMIGYNKVGDNTYPNLVPVLTGLDVTELEESCLPYKNSTFDRCPFIWNKYKEHGYRTLFAEDTAALGLFNYARNGFLEQPTDYYWRTFVRKCEQNIASNKKLNINLCFGSRQPINIFLDYIRKFSTKSIEDPFFSMFWCSTMSHDFLEYPMLMDENFSDLLLELYRGNFLNDTVLFMMSDHGIRWGSFRNTYQGMMEERQPFLISVFPKWFEDKYYRAVRNFRRNRHALTSHFDLYETLKDLLDLSTITSTSIKKRAQELHQSKPTPRGISLFLPIPKTRTCDDAGISDHWCSCHEKRPLTTQDPRVYQAANVILGNLNDRFKQYPQCKTLHLHSIKVANLFISNDHIMVNNVKKEHQFFDVTVHIVTKPGFAEFEATIRFASDLPPELTGTISRTNLYGKQSSCVDDYQMKLYCYCNTS